TGSTASRACGEASPCSITWTIRSGCNWAATSFCPAWKKRRSRRSRAMPQPYHVWPDITIDGTLLSRQIDSQLEQVVVDHHQHLPDMFAIAFHDPARDILGQLNAHIGSIVLIKVTPPGGSAETLIDGEVTSLE